VSATRPGVAAAHVLDLDPDLGWGIEEEDWHEARNVCTGRAVHVDQGVCESIADLRRRQDIVGLLIVDGILCREARMRDRHLIELLGPRDVVQPPAVREWPELSAHTAITAVTPTVMILLGQSFIEAAARWPGILAALQARLEEQRDRLAVKGLIAHLPRAEHRMLLHLWQLASRWGRVSPEGIVLPLPLTHGVLGQLSASRRPTATLAAQALENDGLVRRLDDGTWVLTRAATDRVRSLARTSRIGRLIGQTLTLRHRTSEIGWESHAVRAEAEQTRGHGRGALRRRQVDVILPMTRGEPPEHSRR
jgi:hypothetical protein